MKFIYIVLLIALLGTSNTQQPGDVDKVDTAALGIPYSGEMYGGYLKPSATKFWYYWFFPSQSGKHSDPVLMWMNGGPGCSSLLGATYENGPFKFITGTTTMIKNPNSWNLNAHVLYIESPQTVGFSYNTATDQLANSTDDQQTAVDNLNAVIDFFLKFPSYRQNPFYIAGESYAGVYVPTLVYQIYLYNQIAAVEQINLKGFAVGNPCTHPDECYTPYNNGAGSSPFFFQQLSDHGFFSFDLKEKYDSLFCGDNIQNFNSPDCVQIEDKINHEFNFTNIYDIYKYCYNVPPSVGQSGQRRRVKNKQFKEDQGQIFDCSESIGADWFLNNATVQGLIHVPPTVGTWTMCSNNVNYTMLPEQSFYLYPTLIKAGYRVWVYSGEADADVPGTGTMYWTQLLKTQQQYGTINPWRQWVMNGTRGVPGEYQMAGAVEEYDGFTFLNVKGVGHMVPQWAPEAAQVMIESFLKGVSPPRN